MRSGPADFLFFVFLSASLTSSTVMVTLSPVILLSLLSTSLFSLLDIFFAAPVYCLFRFSATSFIPLASFPLKFRSLFLSDLAFFPCSAAITCQYLLWFVRWSHSSSMCCFQISLLCFAISSVMFWFISLMTSCSGVWLLRSFLFLIMFLISFGRGAFLFLMFPLGIYFLPDFTMMLVIFFTIWCRLSLLMLGNSPISRSIYCS